MHYIIQENLFKERNYELIKSHIKRMGLSYDTITILPFTSEIKTRIVISEENDEYEFVDYVTNHKNVFCFGSVKLAHIGAEKGWYPGSMYNENHDWEVYSKQYKEHLLNYDCIIQRINQPLPNLPAVFFARPCKDTKLFNGGVFMQDSWNEMVDLMLHNTKHKDVLDNVVMFSKLKSIAYETRCWVVDGKVITMSEYKRGNYVIYKNVDDNLYLKQQVQKLVDIYHPADAFVMDVCETIEEPGIVKIVEINCINCAGFYEGNMPLVINSLEEKFNHE